MRASFLIGLGAALATAAPALASPVSAAASGEIPPPPVSVRGGAMAGQAQVLQIPTAEATCGDAPVQAVYAEPLRIEAVGQARPKSAVTLAFAIAADGRTRDIRPAPASADPIAEIVVSSHDVSTEAEQAALAVWRFPAEARSDCRLTVRYAAAPIGSADKDALLRYFALTRGQNPTRDAVSARLGGRGGDCGGARRRERRPRTLQYPDLKIGRAIPPGGTAWSVARWDLDAQGRPQAVETLGSSGDAAFDAETRRAVSASLMEEGAPLKGCVASFYRRGPSLPAPAMPSRPDDPLQTCPAEVSARFQASNGRETYPRAFVERGVEGWAVVRFDLATWGQVGNVAVVEAQPAAAFGDSGRRTVQSARITPSFDPAVRCVIPVRYRTPETVAREDGRTANAASDVAMTPDRNRAAY